MKMSIQLSLRRLGLAACAVLTLAGGAQLHAITLTAAKLIGYVMPANPADPTDETARLQFFVNLLNNNSAVQPDNNLYTPAPGVNVPAVLPSPVEFGTKINSGTLPVTISTPYTYLMAKFGPDAAYYYLGGQTGSLDSLFIPAAFGTNGNGLSHISLFNPTGGGPTVPDSGATIALLGGTLLGLAFLRRRLGK